MYLHRSLFPFYIRLSAYFLVISSIGLMLAAILGTTLPVSLLAYVRVENTPQDRYPTTTMLHVLDIDRGFTGIASEQQSACCPIWSLDGTRVAFSSGGLEIVIWDRLRAQTYPVLDTEINDAFSSWSPDGEAIVVSNSDLLTHNVNLFRIDLDGNTRTQLTFFDTVIAFPLFPVDTAWSPDSRFIFFASKISGEFQLYRIDRDGTDMIQLTDIAGGNLNPRLSPDGKQIAFRSNRDGNLELYLINSDGTEERRLTWTDVHEEVPLWSPDGTRLLFHTYINNATFGMLEVLNVKDGEYRQLADDVALYSTSSWSPSGTQIMYDVKRINKGVELYIMDADGSNRQRLFADGVTSSFQASWQPQP